MINLFYRNHLNKPKIILLANSFILFIVSPLIKLTATSLPKSKRKWLVKNISKQAKKNLTSIMYQIFP